MWLWHVLPRQSLPQRRRTLWPGRSYSCGRAIASVTSVICCQPCASPWLSQLLAAAKPLSRRLIQLNTLLQPGGQPGKLRLHGLVLVLQLCQLLLQLLVALCKLADFMPLLGQLLLLLGELLLQVVALLLCFAQVLP